jgi:hypothetical protein
MQKRRKKKMVIRHGRLLLVPLLLALGGCEGTPIDPGTPVNHATLPAMGVAEMEVAAQPESPGFQNFLARLNGDEEVPAVDTRARGQAIFQLSQDGTELQYKLIVANIENVTMAHIHIAPAGANGPVTAWLYPPGPPPQLIPGRSNGVLADGVITADNLVGPLAGQTLSDLLALLRSGDTYVNVHTSQWPAGEIRGQIRATGLGAP